MENVVLTLAVDLVEWTVRGCAGSRRRKNEC